MHEPVTSALVPGRRSPRRRLAWPRTRSTFRAFIGKDLLLVGLENSVPESLIEQTARISCASVNVMTITNRYDSEDADASALEALEAARAMPQGPARTEALKKAGLLRRQADLRGVAFAKRGRPKKD